MMSEPTQETAVLAGAPAPGPLGPQREQRRVGLGGLARALPPLLVLTALGGLLLWGHGTDWTIPKFSALTGSRPERPDDWCGAHSVPESQCVECNPSLLPRPKAHGWCRRHGVHECPLEHPELAQLAAPPPVVADDLARAQRALEFAPRPENNDKCKAHERRIQFTSQEAVERAGIRVDEACRAVDSRWRTPVVEFATANGETAYDQTCTARLSPRVPGTVFEVYKQAGDAVKQGEVLALVDAAEVGKAKSDFLQALVRVRLRQETLQRLEKGYRDGAVSEQAYRDYAAASSEAGIRLTTAKEAMTNLGLPVEVDSLVGVPQDQLADRLRFLGLPGSVTASLDPRTTTGNLLAITAPFDGLVVARRVVRGEVVDPAKVLFVVADVRRLWLTLDLRLEDARWLRLGQKVLFRPDGSQEEAHGSVTWISTEADPKTRTLKARALFDNREGRLRANVFGTGKIVLREESQAVVVPNGAVHWEGDCYVVFVRDKNYQKPGAPKVFHTRTVRLGARVGHVTEIIAGVLPGEWVAAEGSGALRAELLRANLGEG
jgi:cobalt-zinc-cadmium efflux system membrane fusion protein